MNYESTRNLLIVLSAWMQKKVLHFMELFVILEWKKRIKVDTLLKKGNVFSSPSKNSTTYDVEFPLIQLE